MTRSSGLRTGLLTVLLLVVTLAAPAWAKEKLTVEQVVQKHLENLLQGASPEGLMAPRLIAGISAMKVLDGGTGLVKGKVRFRSAPDAMLLLLEFDSQGYPKDGIRLRPDGDVLPIEVSPGSSGFLAGFLDNYRHIVRSGLLGSVLSAAWPFLREDPGLPNLEYKGEKKVDGKKMHLLECEFEGGIRSDLYFDTKTFRHLRTVHRIPPDRGNAYLTEEFDSFQRVAGIDLPALWRLTVEWRGNRRILYEIGLQNIQSPPPPEDEAERKATSR